MARFLRRGKMKIKNKRTGEVRNVFRGTIKRRNMRRLSVEKIIPHT